MINWIIKFITTNGNHSSLDPSFKANAFWIAFTNITMLLAVFFLIIGVLAFIIGLTRISISNEDENKLAAKIAAILTMSFIFLLMTVSSAYINYASSKRIKTYNFDNVGKINVYYLHANNKTEYVSKVYKYSYNHGFYEYKYAYKYVSQSKPYPTKDVINNKPSKGVE